MTYFDFGIQPIHAAVAAAIGISTSPAVVMLVVRDLRAEGQVTERALNLAAINGVAAVVLTTVLLSWIHYEYRAGWIIRLSHPLYLLAGSLLLGIFAGWAAILLARFVGKSVGIMGLAYFSGIRPGGGGLLAIALMPMSGTSIVIVHGTAAEYPDFGAGLAAIVLPAVVIMELVGPVAVQYALRKAGEAGEERA